jgi:nucleoid-associated protein YgaU
MATKLTIYPCKVNQKTGVPRKLVGDEIEVTINPSAYNRDYKITYGGAGGAGQQPIGLTSAFTKFASYQQQNIKFELVFDGTGVGSFVKEASSAIASMVGGSSPLGTAKTVDDQITRLKAVVYDFDGSEHQPNVVFLHWSSFTFWGRLTSMAVAYTMFKSSGEPLRAKATLEFVSYMSPYEEAKLANKSSPDLTHLVEVKAGDTLPLLCEKIYGDSAYYLDVARVNGLTNFRQLTPGIQLNFPPLR